MSLYDDASLIFTPAGAAGNHNTAHSIKPVEKLGDELIEHGDFATDSGWTFTQGGGVAITGGKAVFTGADGNQDLYRDTPVLSGKTVKISFSISDYEAGTVEPFFHMSSPNPGGNAVSGDGKYSFIKTISAGHNDNTGVRARDNFKGKIDNFSVKEVKQKAIDFKIDRGSDESATLVGADGLIKRHTKNLLKSTEDINNTDHWDVPDTAYVNPAPEGEIVGYNGSKEGVFTIHKTSTDSNHYFMSTFDNAVTTSATDVWTYSVYVKGDGNSKLLMGIWTQYDENADPQQYSYAQRIFTLSGDSLVGNAGGGDADNTYSKPRFFKEKIGNDGWYRLSITNVSAIAGDRVRLQPRDLTGLQNTPGKVYIMHPQFEKNSSATPYVKSGKVQGKGGVLEDLPRFDYSGGGCPGLLLERQVTNELPATEWLYSWAFNGDGSGVVIPNAAISPDGTYNATQVRANNGYKHLRRVIDLDPDTKYVFSFYVKNIDATKLRIAVYDVDDSSWVVENHDYFSEVSTTEWKRIELPFTTNATNTSYGIYILQGAAVVTDGDPGGNVLFWGAQVEEQNHTGNADGYATSYIPNTSGTGTVTRKHDDTDDTDLRFGRDNIFDGDQATIFIEANNLRKVGNTRWWHIFDEDKKEDPRILIYSANGLTSYDLKLQLRADHDSPNETRINGPSLNYGDKFKAIARLNGNIVTLFVNGVQYDAGSTSSTDYDYAQWETETVKPYERFELAHETGDLGHKIFNLMIFPTVLTDDECKNLTSLS